MAIQFSDTSNKTGLIETLARFTGTQTSTTSSYTLAEKTLDINNAYVNFINLASKAAGKQQIDDTNNTTLPLLLSNIVNGTANYSFKVDEASPTNQILELQKLRIKDANGKWTDFLTQIDKNEVDISQFQDITGTPEYYDLIGDNVVFYPTPNYDSSDGIEFTVTRTPVYFLTSDTTKKPGIPDMFHMYLVIRPAYYYCLLRGLPQATQYGNDMLKMEQEIKHHYSNRNKTNLDTMTPEQINSI